MRPQGHLSRPPNRRPEAAKSRRIQLVQHPLAARREAQPAGVIDTISAGYTALNRQLWVLLLPVLVDLFLWLGPQVSFAPLIDPVLQGGVDAFRAASAEVAETGAAGPDMVAQYEQAMQMAMEQARGTNALQILALARPLELPSVAAVTGGAGEFRFVQDWGQALAMVLGTLAGGLILGGLLRGLLAEQVREQDGGADLRRALRRVPVDTLKTVAYTLLWLAIALAVAIPATLLIVLSALLSTNLALILLFIALFALALAEIHLFFTVAAIFVSGLGPVAAMRRSVGLVRRWFGPALWLILLTWLIMAGMEQVWMLLTRELRGPLTISLSILGNAYIVSGLIAASMIFYKERADAAPPPRRR